MRGRTAGMQNGPGCSVDAVPRPAFTRIESDAVPGPALGTRSALAHRARAYPHPLAPLIERKYNVMLHCTRARHWEPVVRSRIAPAPTLARR